MYIYIFTYTHTDSPVRTCEGRLPLAVGVEGRDAHEAVGAWFDAVGV